MSTITISQSAWEDFKTQLLAGCDTGGVDGAPSFHDRVSCAINALEQSAKVNAPVTASSVSVPHQPLASNLAAPTPSCASPARKDAFTQLYTTRGFYFSTHVLNEVKLSHMVRALATRLGSLCCELLSAYDTVWSLLCLHASAGAVTTPRLTADWYRLDQEVDERVMRLPTSAQQRIDTTLNTLDAHTATALCETRPVWRREKNKRQKAPGAQEVSPQAFIRCALAHWSEEARDPIPDSAGPTPTVGPFVCRRCRQDQRGDYAYDRENRRLEGLSSNRSLRSNGGTLKHTLHASLPWPSRPAPPQSTGGGRVLSHTHAPFAGTTTLMRTKLLDSRSGPPLSHRDRLSAATINVAAGESGQPRRSGSNSELPQL